MANYSGVRAILLAMIGIGALAVIFRIARSLVSHMTGVVITAVDLIVLRFDGPGLLSQLSAWLL